MESDVNRDRAGFLQGSDVNSLRWERNIGAEEAYFKKSPRDITRDLITRVDVGSRDQVPWRPREARETTPINVPVRVVGS